MINPFFLSMAFNRIGWGFLEWDKHMLTPAHEAIVAMLHGFRVVYQSAWLSTTGARLDANASAWEVARVKTRDSDVPWVIPRRCAGGTCSATLQMLPRRVSDAILPVFCSTGKQ
jgi:hypothetical protein